MKAYTLTIIVVVIITTSAHAKTYVKPYPFDLHGCKRHLKAIVEAVEDGGGKVEENDDSGRSYTVKLNGKTTIYTCTRHELLETEL